MAGGEWTHEQLDAWLAKEYLDGEPLTHSGLLARLPSEIRLQMEEHRDDPAAPTELPEPLQLLATAWLQVANYDPEHTAGFYVPPVNEPEAKWSNLSLEAKSALRWAYETYVVGGETATRTNAWPDETPPATPLVGGRLLWVGVGMIVVVIGGFVVMQRVDTETGEPIGLESTDGGSDQESDDGRGDTPEADDEVSDAGASDGDDDLLHLADVVIEELDLSGADGVVSVSYEPGEDCGLTGGGDPVFVTGPFDGGPQTSEEGGLFNVDLEFPASDGSVNAVTGGMWPDGSGGLVFDDRKFGSELEQDITDITVGPGSIEGTLVWGDPGGCLTTGQLTLGVSDATSTWLASLPPRGPAPGVLQDYSVSASGNGVDLSGILTLPDGTPLPGETLVTTVNDARQEVTTGEDGSFSVRFEDTAESYISAVHQLAWSLVVDTSKYFSD